LRAAQGHNGAPPCGANVGLGQLYSLYTLEGPPSIHRLVQHGAVHENAFRVEVSESMQRDLHWLASQTDLPKQLDAADWLNLQHPSFILLSQTNLFWTCLNALKLGCCIAFLCGKKCLQACTHSNLGGDSFFATDTADMLLMHVERFSSFARLPIHFDTP